jgi:ATP-dependent helicase HrpA
VELAVQKDLAWLEKDLRALIKFDALYAPLGDSAALRETALDHLRRYVLPTESWPALTRALFDEAVASARGRLPGLATQFMDRLGPVLQLRQQVQQRLGAVASSASSSASRPRALTSLSQLGSPAAVAATSHPLAGELAALLPPRFLDTVNYLKGLMTRSERAALNPAKDEDRRRQLAPYQEAFKKLQAVPARSAAAKKLVEEFRWMLEEFKISLFAQELGTAFPVSPKRLDQHLELVRSAW